MTDIELKTFLSPCNYFSNSALLLCSSLLDCLTMPLRKVDVLDTFKALSSGSISSIGSTLSDLWVFLCFFFTVVCPSILIECLTGARLECTVLKEAMLSLSGLDCLFLLFST